MPLTPVALTGLAATLPPRARLLGLDLGRKSLGLAVADLESRLPVPLETWRRGRLSADAAALADLIEARAIDALIVGLPLSMSGEEGPRAQATRDYVRELVAREAVFRRETRVAFADERLTTAGAADRLSDSGVAPARMARAKRQGHLDALAAQAILEEALRVV